MTGYYVHRKNVVSSARKLMHFGTFLDEDGQFLDTIHFPEVAKKYPFRGPGIYALKGKVVEEFNYFSLEVMAMKKLAMKTLESEQYLKTTSRKVLIKNKNQGRFKV